MLGLAGKVRLTVVRCLPVVCVKVAPLLFIVVNDRESAAGLARWIRKVLLVRTELVRLSYPGHLPDYIS